MRSYDLGDAVTVNVAFTDLDGVATDPTTITLKYEDPSGNQTTKTYAAAQITRTGTGEYNHTIVTDESGTWTYRWVGTGTVEAVEEGSFYVLTSDFVTPSPSTPVLTDTEVLEDLGVEFVGDGGDAIQYVSTTGSNDNDGLSWGRAKLTLKAAYDALPSTGGLVLLGAGTFAVSAATVLTDEKSLVLRGTGRTVTKLERSSAVRIIELGTGTAADDFTGELTIEDVWLDGNAQNADLIKNLNASSRPGKLHFQRCLFWDFGTGVAFKNAATDGPSVEDSTWVDIKTSYGACAVELRLPNWSFHQCTFDNLTIAVKLYGNSKANFYSCVFSTNGKSIQFSEGGTNYANPFLISGCWFENDTDTPIHSANASNRIDLTVAETNIHHLGNYHCYFDVASSEIIFRNVTFGGLTPKVYLRNSSNILRAEECRTWSFQGLITNPFNTTKNYVGPQLLSTDTHAAAPVADTVYRVEGARGVWIKSTGGTDVDIYLNDKTLAGGFVGLGATCAVWCPAGALITFGAFSVAPTVQVWPD